MRAQTRTFLQSKWPTAAFHFVPPLPSHRPVRRSNLISISKGGSNLSFAILRSIARAGALVSAVMLIPAAHAAVPDMPTVEGPITGPGEMQPGIRPGPGGTNREDFGCLSDGTRAALDDFGNAKGGVRTTYLDVPLFTYTIPNTGPGLCNQTGYQTRLPELYKNYGQYVSKVEHRLKDLKAYQE